jgi:hypothetical protein
MPLGCHYLHHKPLTATCHQPQYLHCTQHHLLHFAMPQMISECSARHSILLPRLWLHFPQRTSHKMAMHDPSESYHQFLASKEHGWANVSSHTARPRPEYLQNASSHWLPPTIHYHYSHVTFRAVSIDRSLIPQNFAIARYKIRHLKHVSADGSASLMDSMGIDDSHMLGFTNEIRRRSS